MGRYLALGVVTTVSINAGKKIDLEKNKKKIETELGRYLDLSKYDWEQKSNGFYLKIQVEHFNENIHDIYFIKQSNVTSFFFNSLKKPTS